MLEEDPAGGREEEEDPAVRTCPERRGPTYLQNPTTEPKLNGGRIWAALLRYIDDGFSLCKVNVENSYGFQVNGVWHRVKHAIQSQNIFRHMVRGAEDIGMVANA